MFGQRFTRRDADLSKKKISYDIGTYTAVLRLKINQYDNFMSCGKSLRAVKNRRVDCI